MKNFIFKAVRLVNENLDEDDKLSFFASTSSFGVMLLLIWLAEKNLDGSVISIIEGIGLYFIAFLFELLAIGILVYRLVVLYKRERHIKKYGYGMRK